MQKCGAVARRAGAKIPKYPVACRNVAKNPLIGATGIGILAFRLLDPASVLAGVSWNRNTILIDSKQNGNVSEYFW